MPESATRKKEPHERGPEDVTAPSNSNTLLGKHKSSTERDKDYMFRLSEFYTNALDSVPRMHFAKQATLSTYPVAVLQPGGELSFLEDWTQFTDYEDILGESLGI
jgi:hypothetical protein